MSLSSDLDQWAVALAAASGLTVTRDPGEVFPPCIFVGMPDAQQITIGELTALDIPVYLVAPSPASKARGDWLLDHVGGFITAVAPVPRTASAQSLTVDGGEYPAYLAIAQLHLT